MKEPERQIKGRNRDRESRSDREKGGTEIERAAETDKREEQR